MLAQLVRAATSATATRPFHANAFMGPPCLSVAIDGHRGRGGRQAADQSAIAW